MQGAERGKEPSTGKKQQQQRLKKIYNKIYIGLSLSCLVLTGNNLYYVAQTQVSNCFFLKIKYLECLVFDMLSIYKLIIGNIKYLEYELSSILSI